MYIYYREQVRRWDVEESKQMYVCIYVGKRVCVEPLKNKIEILKIDVIMIVTIIRLDSCNKDYYIK